MGPVATPFEGVAVHVVQAPGIGGIAADFGGAAEGRSGFGAIVRLAFEVRLFAAEFVAERSGGGGAGAAGVFPLGFGGEAEFPIAGDLIGIARELGEFAAERFGFGEVDVADGEVVAGRKFCGERAGKRAHDLFPEALSGFEFGHPKTFGECDLDLVFTGATLWFGGWTAHGEGAGRTPAEGNIEDVGLGAGFGAGETIRWRGRFGGERSEKGERYEYDSEAAVKRM